MNIIRTIARFPFQVFRSQLSKTQIRFFATQTQSRQDTGETRSGNLNDEDLGDINRRGTDTHAEIHTSNTERDTKTHKTGESRTTTDGKNQTMSELGKMGGKARAEKLSQEELSEIGRKGGQARAEKLSHEEMSEIGRKGGQARAEKLSQEEQRETGRKGGKARLRNVSHEEMGAIGKKGGQARADKAAPGELEEAGRKGVKSRAETQAQPKHETSRKINSTRDEKQTGEHETARAANEERGETGEKEVRNEKDYKEDTPSRGVEGRNEKITEHQRTSQGERDTKRRDPEQRTQILQINESYGKLRGVLKLTSRRDPLDR